MSMMTQSARAIKGVVVLFAPSKVKRSANFGKGLETPTPKAPVPQTHNPRHQWPTQEEVDRWFRESTFSVEEMQASRHFGITLEEARNLLAMGEDYVRDAESLRMRAWEEMNEADEYRPAKSATLPVCMTCGKSIAVNQEIVILSGGRSQCTRCFDAADRAMASEYFVDEVPPRKPVRRRRTNAAAQRRAAAAR